MSPSLWGAEFDIPDPPKKTRTKQIIDKINKPDTSTIPVEKVIKSKTLSIDEQLRIITKNVHEILGTYEKETITIYSREQLHSYIDTAILNGDIAIDTETNNSLDPITCKLMGVCIYTKGEKHAYIPINHVDKDTGERLGYQLTEKDIFDEFERIKDIKVIMHNGKFDYSVIKCTTGCCISIYWDTMIGAKVLDENELSAGLKQQYITKIDPSIEKYSIEHLFENIEYAFVDPALFALYAATDAYMTYKLYEYQLREFSKVEHQGIYNLFKTVEMPLVAVIAEMEMAGMEVDQEYGARLSNKYHNILDSIDIQINNELSKLSDTIALWRLTPDANYRPPNKKGDGEGKSKAEQLTDPINLASPTQLAILIYDILKAPVVNKKKPRGTGEVELIDISKKLDLPLFKLILDRREQVKLLTTYIDVIPELAKRWPDGRVRTHFNQYGAATGRLSSSEPLNF